MRVSSVVRICGPTPSQATIVPSSYAELSVADATNNAQINRERDSDYRIGVEKLPPDNLVKRILLSDVCGTLALTIQTQAAANIAAAEK